MVCSEGRTLADPATEVIVVDVSKDSRCAREMVGMLRVVDPYVKWMFEHCMGLSLGLWASDSLVSSQDQVRVFSLLAVLSSISSRRRRLLRLC